ALAFGSTCGGAGYARSPQPLPVGTRSASSASGASTCAANAVDVKRQSRLAALKIDRIRLCMNASLVSCALHGWAIGPADSIVASRRSQEICHQRQALHNQGLMNGRSRA